MQCCFEGVGGGGEKLLMEDKNCGKLSKTFGKQLDKEEVVLWKWG